MHVFFEHRGLLASRIARPTHDAGASSFLYPFLAEQEQRLEPVLADVAQLRANEVPARSASCAKQTLIDNHLALAGCGGSAQSQLPRAAASCSRSATAAPPPTRWTWSPTSGPSGGGRPRRPALDLTEDSADPHRARQRHRQRCDLLAPGDRSRRPGRRARRLVHLRWLPQRDRGARAGRRKRDLGQSRWSDTTAVVSPPMVLRTSSW